MKRLTLAAVGALLVMPAAALAGPGSGTVLSVNGAHRTIEVVNSGHVVHAYMYHGSLPNVHAGSRIEFRRSGKAISDVKALTRGNSSVSFYARVVRSSKRGVVLRLADGRTVKVSSKQLRGRSSKRSASRKHNVRAHAAAGSITINIEGLEPGVTVLVTEAVDEHGNVTITIALPGPSGGLGSQTASGVVADVDQDAFVVETEDGSDLRLHMAARALAHLGLQVCDTVDVTYHQDAAILVADRVDDTGSSSSGDCADHNSQDEVGTITAVSGDGITVDTQDNGSMTFAVDSSDITDGFQVGDLVDVTYTDNGDGTYDASDVEYVEQDATGTVTAVSDGSMTFIDSDSGQPVTVTADPAAGVFDRVAVGDEVDVNYHQSGTQLVADEVDDGG
jgi:Domain of unknown function (DUF5666)